MDESSVYKESPNTLCSVLEQSFGHYTANLVPVDPSNIGMAAVSLHLILIIGGASLNIIDLAFGP
jgi:hypothetical protein